jgi:hypothetical protein
MLTLFATPFAVPAWQYAGDLNCYAGAGATDLERPEGVTAGTMTLAVCQAACQGTDSCTGITVCNPPSCFGRVPAHSGAQLLCYRRANISVANCAPSGIGYGEYQTFLLDRTASPPVPAPSSWEVLRGLNCYADHGARELDTPLNGSSAGVMTVGACKAACVGTPP